MHRKQYLNQKRHWTGIKTGRSVLWISGSFSSAMDFPHESNIMDSLLLNCLSVIKIQLTSGTVETDILIQGKSNSWYQPLCLWLLQIPSTLGEQWIYPFGECFSDINFSHFLHCLSWYHCLKPVTYLIYWHRIPEMVPQPRGPFYC